VFFDENVRTFARPFACWGVYALCVHSRVMVMFNLRLVSNFIHLIRLLPLIVCIFANDPDFFKKKFTLNLDVFACVCFFAFTVNVQDMMEIENGI